MQVDVASAESAYTPPTAELPQRVGLLEVRYQELLELAAEQNKRIAQLEIQLQT